MIQELADRLRYFDAPRLIMRSTNPPHFVAESLVPLCTCPKIGRRNRTALVGDPDAAAIPEANTPK